MQVLVTVIRVAQKQPQAMRKPVGTACSNETVDLKNSHNLKDSLGNNNNKRLSWPGESGWCGPPAYDISHRRSQAQVGNSPSQEVVREAPDFLGGSTAVVQT